MPLWSLCPSCSLCDLGLVLWHLQSRLQSAVNFLNHLVAEARARLVLAGLCLPRWVILGALLWVLVQVLRVLAGGGAG